MYDKDYYKVICLFDVELSHVQKKTRGLWPEGQRSDKSSQAKSKRHWFRSANDHFDNHAFIIYNDNPPQMFCVEYDLLAPFQVYFYLCCDSHVLNNREKINQIKLGVT